MQLPSRNITSLQEEYEYFVDNFPWVELSKGGVFSQTARQQLSKMAEEIGYFRLKDMEVMMKGGISRFSVVMPRMIREDNGNVAGVTVDQRSEDEIAGIIQNYLGTYVPECQKPLEKLEHYLAKSGDNGYLDDKEFWHEFQRCGERYSITLSIYVGDEYTFLEDLLEPIIS